jgi:hypothetical protein
VKQQWLRFRQWTFPEEFRLAPIDEAPELDLLRLLLSQAAAAPAPSPAAAPPSPASSPPGTPASPTASAPPAIDNAFLVELCNTHFRVRRNANEMALKSPDSVEVRRIANAVKSLDRLLDEHRIECLDLEGKPYDDGRRDFEPLGVEDAPGSLDRPVIGRCERPLIRRDGALVQKGRGIVLRPAGLAAAGG